MYRTFFVFLKCTIQCGSKVDLLLIAYLHLWLKFWKGIDKYWIVPVRKLFYFHHCIHNGDSFFVLLLHAVRNESTTADSLDCVTLFMCLRLRDLITL